MKNLLLALFTFFLIFSVDAQTSTVKDTTNYPYWLEMMQDNSVSIFKTKRAFDVYWKNRTIEKGCGYKPFMRWYHRMEMQCDEQGMIPNPQVSVMEYYNFLNKYGVGSNQFNIGGLGSGPASCNTSGDWKELGPTGLPTNQPSQPNGNGRVNSITFHPSDSNTFWVGSPQGGLWKTTNGGQNWTSNTDAMPTLGVSDMAIHPTNANIMYLGTGDRDGNDAPGRGVYKSTNGGTTWTVSNTGMGNRTVSKVIINPTTPTTVIAATTSGIYRSTNSGASWSSVQGGHFRDIVFHPTNPNIVYAARYGSSLAHFYKSTNGGASFTQITSGLPTNGYRGAIGVTKSMPNVVYFLITNQRTYKGMYISYNSGTSFKTQSTTPNIMDYSHLATGTGGQAWYDLDIAVDPNRPQDVYVCGVNVFKSTDSGKTWTINAHWVGSGGAPAVHADHHAMEFSPITNALFTGNDGGVHKTVNGGSSYTELTNDLRISQIYRCAQSATNRDWAINGYQDNGTGMMRGNKTWYTVMGGDGMDCQINPSTTQYAYSDLYYGDVRRYTNGVYSGKIAANGTNGINQQGAWVTSFVLREGTPSTMFIGYDDVWRSTNIQNGTASTVTWTKISSFSSSADIHFLENCIANPDVMYVSKKDGYMYRSANVNAGSPTWTQLSRPTSTWPRWIETDPNNANTVYIAQSNNIYKSTNGGTSWTDISGNLPNSTINCILYDTSAGMEALYVGMNVGVYYKDATMSNWVLFNKNLPATSEITDLDIYYDPVNPECSHILASTYGRGNWRSYLYPSASRKPKPRFYAEDTIINRACGSTATTKLYNESCDFPTRYLWVISPAVTYINGTDSCSENPEVQFNSAGTYSVKLLAENCNGLDSIEETNYITVFDSLKSATCTPTYTTPNNATGIYEVDLAGYNRVSAGSASEGVYVDLTCTDVIKLVPNTAYSLDVRVSSANAHGVRAYIDYDNNGTFNTGTEQVATSASATGTHTLNFTTPATPIYGKILRLRIVSRFASSTIAPCGTGYSYGQTEDYGVYFESATDALIARVGNQDSVCPSQVVSIVDSATTSATTYAWNFGTNATPQTATGKGPHQVVFGSLGWQTVTLTADGKNYTKDSLVFVKQGPNLKEGLHYGSLPTCAGDSIVLWAVDSNATNPTYQWQKNGSNISGSNDTLLTFGNIATTDNGTYRMIATSLGCSDTSTSITVTANPKAVADFTITTDTSQCLGGNSFQFSNGSSVSSGVLSYNWSFGDGNTSSATSPSHTYAAAGTYTVKLVASLASGCDDSITKTVIVRTGPTASFTIDDSTRCYGSNTFSFTNNSSGGGTYAWSFGDGTSASTTNASRTYTSSGTYVVKLVATNSGCSDSMQRNVHLYEVPKVGFTTNKDTQCLSGNSFAFVDTTTAPSGSTLSHNWNFGDGNGITGVSVNHNYTSSGTYTVKLVTSTSQACTDSVSKMVRVNQMPTSNFSINDTSQCRVGNSFIFTNTSSNASNYSWTFGDGTSASGLNASKSYSSIGTYVVKLVAEQDGCLDSISKNAHVNPMPTVGFTIDNDTQCLANNSFTYLDTSTIASGTLSRSWAFGDGGSSTSINPSHTYSTDSTKTVKLIVSSNAGCMDSTTKQVYLSPSPIAQFSPNDTVQCLTGNYFVFSNTSSISRGFMRFEWEFGNDSTSTITNGIEQYQDTGTYQVKLRVYSLAGDCVDSVARSVRVNSSPVANFSVVNDTQCFNQHLLTVANNATYTSGSDIDSFYFGDGFNSTASNPTHTYTTYGLYTIEHKIISPRGCRDSMKDTIEIMPSPSANFYTLDPIAQCLRGNNFNFTNGTLIPVGTFSSEWEFGDGNTSTSKNTGHSYNLDSAWDVQLIVTSDFNCKDTLIKTYTVHPDVEIGFDIDKDTQCLTGHIFRFEDTSSIRTGSYTRLWKLGDGDTSSVDILGKIYSVAQGYTVTLLVESDQGCKDSTKKDIVLYHSAVAGFNINQDKQCLDGNNFTFTNTSSSTGGTLVYNWDFGDGATTTNVSPSHTYNLDSIRTVRLIAQVVDGCSDTISKDIEVYPMPIVHFTMDDSTQCLSTNSVSFTDYSTVRYGTLNTHTWDFGDGNTTSSTNANHSYSSFGNFVVTKFVETNNGCIDSFKSPLEIYEPPMVSFTVNKDSQCFNGNSFVYTNGSSVGSGTLQYTWDVGDNSAVQSTRDASRTYSASGNVTVKLIVETSNNCRDSIQDTVSVMPEPIASFSLADSSQCLDGNAYVINDNSSISSGVLRYNWDFGDGTSATVPNPPIKTYSSDQVYTIRLVVASSFGCADNAQRDLIVHPMPKASFIADPLQMCLRGNSFDFTGNSTITKGTIVNRDWDFGDGATATNTSIETHSYASDGTYSVSLIVESNEGCTDDSTMDVTVFPHPTASFTTANVCLGDTAYFTFTGSSASSYFWSFGDGGISNAPDPSRLYKYSDTFDVRLIVTSADNCKDTANTTDAIVVYPKPIADFSSAKVRSGGKETVMQYTDASTDATLWQWDFGDGGVSNMQNPEYTFSDTGTFPVRLVARNGFGCVDTAYEYKFIFPDFVYHVPTGFSPNQDFLNDVWKGEGLAYANKFRMRVYNRWGELMFESFDPDVGWDGTYAGEPLQMGTYIYLIDIEDLNHDTHHLKGEVVLWK